MSQEKLQTMVMQTFWGVIEVYYGIVQVVNCTHLKYYFTFRVIRLTFNLLLG